MSARFDSLALRPPAAAADEVARLQAWPDLARSLQAWCLQGAVPRPDQRLALGHLAGAAGDDGAALVPWADAFARQIDGGTRLDAMPRLAGLAWRLQVKLNDLLPGRQRQPDDPWDAGWASTTPPALRQLQAHWRPRRPTLLLARVSEAPALRLALAALGQREGEFRHAVRWLWVGSAAATSGQPLARFDAPATPD